MHVWWFFNWNDPFGFCVSKVHHKNAFKVTIHVRLEFCVTRSMHISILVSLSSFMSWNRQWLWADEQAWIKCHIGICVLDGIDTSISGNVCMWSRQSCGWEEFGQCNKTLWWRLAFNLNSNRIESSQSNWKFQEENSLNHWWIKYQF